jgi:A nuclease of the HNH/ENDO VII superfamily with conserved WHH/SMI1 / KNR4 family (SUKH-1)
MTQGSGMGSPTLGGIPNGQFAGRLIEFSDPELDRKYPRGVYVNLHGYPDFSVYARCAAEIADPPSGLSADEVRVTDVIAANLIGAASGDPLWQQGRPTIVTPEGWTWAHEARTRRLFLVPVDLHASFRHHGGIATLPTDPSKTGLWHEGMLEPVAFERSGSVPEEALSQLESQLGFPLPPSYRRFLGGTDGGRPLVPAVNLACGFIADSWLFGLRRSDPHQDLVYANQALYDRFTEEYLGIGFVQGGMIAVKIRGGDLGSVWYFNDDDPRDHDGRDAGSVCAELLVRIGNDFDDFARHLVALPKQLMEISQSAVDSGFGHLVTDLPYLGSALPDHLRRR